MRKIGLLLAAIAAVFFMMGCATDGASAAKKAPSIVGEWKVVETGAGKTEIKNGDIEYYKFEDGKVFAKKKGSNDDYSQVGTYTSDKIKLTGTGLSYEYTISGKFLTMKYLGVQFTKCQKVEE